MSSSGRFITLGNAVSLVAAVLIAVVLVGITLSGLSVIFTVWALALMWVLWGMGIAAYIMYSSANLTLRPLMVYATPAALVITLVGLVFLTMHMFLGAELVVVGYFLEPIAGVSLYLTLLRVSKYASHIFFWGAVLFTVGLPLILIKATLVPLVGDLIKLIGFMMLMGGSFK